MAGPLVIINEYDNGIYCVKLNRPKKLNALSIEMRETLADHFNRLAEDSKCRGIVLTGAGTAFCAGMDFTQFGGDRENKLRLLHSTRGLFSSLLRFPKPLIGAINGAAVGGGFSLALCCDERIASETAYFGFYEVRRGIPAPYDIVRLFVDDATARDWCETGRRVDAVEAIDVGIVKDNKSGEALVNACRREAKRRSKSGRIVSTAIKLAFRGEMELFERALFPEKLLKQGG